MQEEFPTAIVEVLVSPTLRHMIFGFRDAYNLMLLWRYRNLSDQKIILKTHILNVFL